MPHGTWNNKELSKDGLGSCDYSSDNLSMWQNRTITQLSMYAAITPLIQNATRANVVSHNRNLLSISTYHKGMGGVDLLDFLSASYRPSISGNSGTDHYLLMY